MSLSLHLVHVSLTCLSFLAVEVQGATSLKWQQTQTVTAMPLLVGNVCNEPMTNGMLYRIKYTQLPSRAYHQS